VGSWEATGHGRSKWRKKGKRLRNEGRNPVITYAAIVFGHDPRDRQARPVEGRLDNGQRERGNIQRGGEGIDGATAILRGST